MSWRIRIVKPGAATRRVGDAFYAPHLSRSGNGKPSLWLSKQYVETWIARRPPICVALPMGTGVYFFCVDSPFRRARDPDDARKANPDFAGWVVTGDLPRITLSPSVDMSAGNGWHGWITNGVVSDDVNPGVVFSDEGVRLLS